MNTPLGCLQATINDGARSSSAASYLEPDFVDRPNLHILLGAYGTRVFQASSDDDKEVKINTVEFLQSSGKQFANHLRFIAPRPLLLVNAVKEVILSAP